MSRDHSCKIYSPDMSAFCTVHMVSVTGSDSYLPILFGEQVLYDECCADSGVEQETD